MEFNRRQEPMAGAWGLRLTPVRRVKQAVEGPIHSIVMQTIADFGSISRVYPGISSVTT